MTSPTWPQSGLSGPPTIATPTHCNGARWAAGQRSCNSCGAVAPLSVIELPLCPRCGVNVITQRNALRCSTCATTSPAGGFGPYEPSQIPVELGGLTRRRLQKQSAELREQFARTAAELPDLDDRYMRVVERLRVLAESIGGVEQRLTGRDSRSVIDEILHRARQQVADAGRALAALRL